MYNDIVMDHFSDPRNVGEIPDANGIGEIANPIDGDKIKIFYWRFFNDFIKRPN